MTQPPAPPSPDPHAEWRHAEDKFYGAVLANPDMYMAGVRLVRAIADSLGDVEDIEQLETRYDELDASYVSDVVRRLNEPRLALLDHARALGAAFRLRSQEIAHRRHGDEAKRRIAAAVEQGDEWVVLFEEDTERNGVAFFNRVEMHLASGAAFRTANELDWERGWVYVLEPMVLEVESGRIRSDVDPPGPRQEFTSMDDLDEALASLRDRPTG